MRSSQISPRKSPLHILVSNDDGIDAPGIFALVTSLKKIGNVTVVAPERQQSAVGHAITMNHPIRVKEYFHNGEFFGYAVDGTPADCVKIAIRSILKRKPDIVVSGINHGTNTAISVIYSGTVSAATEATLMKVPSLAISLATFTTPDFRYAAKFSMTMVKAVLGNGLPQGTLLNVNVPPISEQNIRGVKITRMGKSTWNDTFEARRDPANKEYFWLTGDLEVQDTEEDIDQVAVMNKFVSVTPIHYDLTNYDMLDELQKWKLKKSV
ncbi:MAG: 5'/3'-nucleotidase SurE [Ignavibacteriales bacterium]|nr:5'/3'-nucleotidase SurE [Ignavibacteriales bacterium]